MKDILNYVFLGTGAFIFLFITYSMNNIYFDKRNYKYVLAIAIQVCNSIFCSLGTILFIINDFIIKLNFMN